MSPHITVCICTYKRPQFLKRLLGELVRQRTGGAFTYSVAVADNDHLQSARGATEEFAATSSIKVIYGSEPRQNIALARNKALESASGNYIAFIDDDEIPAHDWLYQLYRTCIRYNADGVLGPVRPYFEHTPPQWATKGRFFERPDHQTGFRLDWRETRTGNVLFRKSLLEGIDEAFNPEFGTGGEDTDFFRRMTLKGHSFIWCHEAVVYELVPVSRCNRGYLLRRALLRGGNLPKHQHRRVSSLGRSLLAVPCYTVALPLLALSGEHVLLTYLIKLFHHAGHILATLGLFAVREKEM